MNTTYHTEFINNIPVGIPNRITKDVPTYYISYNNRDIGTYGSDTTALHINETSQFLILNGNHTAGFKDLNTLKDCLNYFYVNIDIVNIKSEHGKVFKMIDGKAKYIKGGY